MRCPAEIKAVLEGNDACTLSVVAATRELLGPQFMVWEPETIRLELHDSGVDIHAQNFDALMAVITLVESTAFFWDANIFEDVCAALNATSPQFDSVNEVCPAQIAWGVKQAHLIVDSLATYEIPDELKKDERFDYEPVSYTAAACLHAGLVTVPDELSFARERLEELSSADEDLLSNVKEAWGKLDKEKLELHPYPEDEVGVQLALMATIPLYIAEQQDATKNQVALLDAASSD